MNILEVRDQCKTFGTGEAEVQALNHVCFPVSRGNLDSKNSQEVIPLLQSMSVKNQQTILIITDNENHAGAADCVFRMSDCVRKDLGVLSQ